MIGIREISFGYANHSLDATAKVTLDATEGTEVDSWMLDLCIVDSTGEPHYATTAVEVEESGTTANIGVGRIDPGVCDGYVLLRRRGERIELPAVRFELDH